MSKRVRPGVPSFSTTTDVDAGDTLCESQIEKVSVDVTAPADGVVEEIALHEDDEFTGEDTLAYLRPD